MAPDEAYEAAAIASSGDPDDASEPALRAAVDAVWPLAEARGRQQMIDALRAFAVELSQQSDDTEDWEIKRYLATEAGAIETAADRLDSIAKEAS